MTIQETIDTVAKLNKQIDKAYEKIRAIQAACKHPDKRVAKVYKGDTGNWDPYQDSYWVEKDCGVCGKRWSVDSKEPGYR